MQKKVIFLLILTTLFFVVGCKSTPEPEVEPTPAPVEEVVPVEPTPGVTKPDLSEENAALSAQVSDAKAKAIAAGVKDSFNAEFESISAAYDEAKKAYDAGGDQEVFNARAKETLELYKALEMASSSKSMKKAIDELDFAKFDEAKYVAGSTSLDKVASLFAEKASSQEILAAAEDAYNNMYAVYAAGYVSICEAKITSIEDVKKQADELKAAKGDKDGYAAALAMYNIAKDNFAAKEYDAAYKGLETTLVAFTGVYETVVEKRKKAEEAIARAKEKTGVIHQFAEEADEIAPLPPTAAEEFVEEVVETVVEEVTEAGETAAEIIEETVQEVDAK